MTLKLNLQRLTIDEQCAFIQESTTFVARAYLEWSTLHPNLNPALFLAGIGEVCVSIIGTGEATLREALLEAFIEGLRTSSRRAGVTAPPIVRIS